MARLSAASLPTTRRRVSFGENENEEKQKILMTRGLMNQSQYELIYKIIKSRAPCNLLVFGVGEDSYLWNNANKEGRKSTQRNVDCIV